MTDKIREAFEAENGSTYEGDFAKYEDGEYVSELQQNNYLNFKAGYEAAQPKWLPIESAPLYDELGIIARKGYFVFWTNWDEEDGWYTVNMFYENSQSGKDRKWRPTHWQPLPPEGE